MRIDIALPGDDAEIRRLLRDNPMEGEVRLTLEREPSCHLAAGIQGDSHQAIVARDDASGRLLGMGGRSVLRAWVNGEPRRVEYLSQLRLDRSSRGRVGMIREGYRRLAELRRGDETSLSVTTIVEDNNPARRLLEAGLPGLPRYVPLESFVTLVLPAGRGAWRRPPDGLQIDRAGASDLAAIVDCLARAGSRRQLAPLWRREDLLSETRARGLAIEDFLIARRGGRPAGCLAVWDQRAFKQSVVRGYTGRLRLMRPMMSLLPRWAGAPRLPEPGQALRHAFLSHVAVEADDPGALQALVDRARGEEARRRGLDAVVLGMAARDPLYASLARRPHREYRSLIYEVLWNGGPPTRLDGRVAHLEAAIL